MMTDNNNENDNYDNDDYDDDDNNNNHKLQKKLNHRLQQVKGKAFPLQAYGAQRVLGG
jgi:hypothetical protein